MAMVRNIEAALGGIALQSTQSQKEIAKKEDGRKLRSGGKLVRMAEGIR